MDLAKYPNLYAILIGTIAGNFREWPAVRGELSHFLADVELAAEKAKSSLTLSREETDRLRAGIQKALDAPNARAYILEHTLKNGADNCCEGRCQGHGIGAAAIRSEAKGERG